LLDKNKRIMIRCLIAALPMLISCANAQNLVIPPVENNGKVSFECVIPLNDVQKNQAFENFETYIKPIFPDYKIHLNFVKGDTNAYNAKIKVMMYSDTPPDIFYSGDRNFTAELSSLERIQPLENNLSSINYWNLVIPSTKVISDAGHIYAVPIDEAYYNVLLINTELFSENKVEIPESFEQLKSTVKQFKDKSITPIAIGGKNGMSVYNMIESFACTLDHDITSKILSGKDQFSGKTFSQAAKSVKELIKLSAFPEKTGTFSDEEAGNIFYSSKAAMYSTSTENLNLANNKLNGKVAVLFYPDLDTDGSSPKNIVSGGTKKDCGLLISSSTKHPTEATKLAVEMSKYYNKYLYETQGDAVTIYNLDNMKWTPSNLPDLGVKKLIINVKQKDHVNTGLCEYNISPVKEKSIQEASTAFIAGLLSISDYLKALDINMKLT